MFSPRSQRQGGAGVRARHPVCYTRPGGSLLRERGIPERDGTLNASPLRVIGYFGLAPFVPLREKAFTGSTSARVARMTGQGCHSVGQYLRWP